MPLRLPQELINAASDRAVELTKARLGVEELTPEIQEAISGKVSDSASTRFLRDLDGIAASAVSGVSAASAKVRVKDSLSAGLDALKQVVDDEKYNELVVQSARMMFRKFTALKDAGFTEDQAFELVKAETLARGRGAAR